jgi:hypothetical protein
MIENERPDHLQSSIYVMPERARSGRKVGRGKEVVRAEMSHGDVEPNGPRTLGFDAKGLHTDEADDMVAKRVETDRSVRFFVKFSTSGHDIGHMFNPFGIYFRPEEVRRDQAKTGRARYEYRQVPERAFADYLHFLTSRVESFLRNAERQVLDA